MRFDHPLAHRPHQSPRVLIAGGGVAGIETLLALRVLAENQVALELLAPEPAFVYRPLAVAETFGLGEEHRFELSRIAADQGAGLHADGLASVEPARHVARTSSGAEIGYDALVVARGAQPRDAVSGAITFAGARDIDAVQAAVAEAEDGAIAQLVFAAPGGVSWPLPLYELALMTAARLRRAGSRARISVVTAEDSPLDIFGTTASESVSQLLADAGIDVIAGEYPASFQDGELHLVPDRVLKADRVIALPWLEGPRIPGLPHDQHGFIPVDRYGAVTGVADVYAVGDVANFPIKQGGLAAQQADSVAEVIAARAGVDVRPQPFRPMLRGMLLTGGQPEYLRAEPTGGRGESVASDGALWWPPSKIAGRYLAPYLALRPGLQMTRPDGPALEVELELEHGAVSAA
jgi:sulfide:quinone oxidoreductase